MLFSRAQTTVRRWLLFLEDSPLTPPPPPELFRIIQRDGTYVTLRDTNPIAVREGILTDILVTLTDGTLVTQSDGEPAVLSYS